jgi:hypothetical protein
VCDTVVGMKKTLLVLCVMTLSACSVSKREMCEEWRSKGELAASFEDCVACAESLGSRDTHEVRSCAFRHEVDQVGAK